MLRSIQISEIRNGLSGRGWFEARSRPPQGHTGEGKLKSLYWIKLKMFNSNQTHFVLEAECSHAIGLGKQEQADVSSGMSKTCAWSCRLATLRKYRIERQRILDRITVFNNCESELVTFTSRCHQFLLSQR